MHICSRMHTALLYKDLNVPTSTMGLFLELGTIIFNSTKINIWYKDNCVMILAKFCSILACV